MFESKKKIEMWVSCGDDYYYGQNGEKVDYEMAAIFYGKAEAKKHPRATFMLALCYEQGKGVDKDEEYAEFLYEKAAKLGDADAQNRLKSGKTVAPPAPMANDDDEYGKEIIADAPSVNKTETAKKSGNQSSLVKRAMKLNDKGEFGEAYRILKPLAEEGDTDAMFCLTQVYGGWVKPDEARQWLKKAAAQGHRGAENALREQQEAERRQAEAANAEKKAMDMYSLAWSEMEQKDYKSGISRLERVAFQNVSKEAAAKAAFALYSMAIDPEYGGFSIIAEKALYGLKRAAELNYAAHDIEAVKEWEDHQRMAAKNNMTDLELMKHLIEP